MACPAASSAPLQPLRVAASQRLGAFARHTTRWASLGQYKRRDAHGAHRAADTVLAVIQWAGRGQDEQVQLGRLIESSVNSQSEFNATRHLHWPQAFSQSLCT
jgi:hypothetical protein